MTSRRTFIQTLAAGAALSATPLARLAARAQASRLTHPLTGGLGLQLYSLRHLFPKDVPGTLSLISSWGFTIVEGGPLNKMSAADSAALLKKHGLRAASTGAGYEQCRDNLQAAIANARTLGAEYVMVAWIPHKERFTRAEADQAIKDFTAWGKAFKENGIRFTYHVHGYEFQRGADGGTLFDHIAANTDPSIVNFEMDIFWVVRGGGDPLALFRKYPGRFVLTHIKDIRKGTLLCDPTGNAPDDTSVVVGEGMINYPELLKEANAQKVPYHFIEDEHPEAEKQIPRTLKYLADLKL